jgi:hypothetical protein
MKASPRKRPSAGSRNLPRTPSPTGAGGEIWTDAEPTHKRCLDCCTVLLTLAADLSRGGNPGAAADSLLELARDRCGAFVEARKAQEAPPAKKPANATLQTKTVLKRSPGIS